MASSMAALESKVTEVKRDVSSNTAHIDEAERCISDTEDATEKQEPHWTRPSSELPILNPKLII